MDISLATFWWVLAGLAVAIELTTGSFYLLMLALGLAAGALAAHLGQPLSLQIVVAALVGGGATALWHWRRKSHPRSAPARENRDVILDIGERVRVDAWADDRTTRVDYRGSTWSARLAPGAQLATGPHVVTALDGNWLVLRPAQLD